MDSKLKSLNLNDNQFHFENRSECNHRNGIDYHLKGIDYSVEVTNFNFTQNQSIFMTTRPVYIFMLSNMSIFTTRNLSIFVTIIHLIFRTISQINIPNNTESVNIYSESV